MVLLSLPLRYDNGNKRNGAPALREPQRPGQPTVADDPSQFSRAVEYELDLEQQTVRLVYEFKTGASHAKGAARRLRNGNTLVTCPECPCTSGDGRGVVYEADKDAQEVSRVEICGDVYRAQPVDSVPGTVAM